MLCVSANVSEGGEPGPGPASSLLAASSTCSCPTWSGNHAPFGAAVHFALREARQPRRDHGAVRGR
eukprot:13942084-Heterocapsa_arctica.AAC.1